MPRIGGDTARTESVWRIPGWRGWLAWRLARIADRICPEQAFRKAGFTFRFVKGTGAVLWDGQSSPYPPGGCPLWYYGPQYDMAANGGEWWEN